jgi:DNA-directed RNA polymerase sigma subunit (sigma70/sigma32)
MAHPEEQAPSLEERREMFLALVEAQDRDMTVTQSRKAIAERFKLSEQRVRQIEREGLDGHWPPLG